MRIAYLINQYPKVSHSFIRREIQALERRGITVMRIAIRGWNDRLVDADDLAERKRTHYALRGGAIALITASLRAIVVRPIKLLRALLTEIRIARHSDRPLHIHLVYLAEACQILLWLREQKIDHVHAHFGTNSAEVAMLVHLLGGPPFSFTVHGPEEFDKPQSIALAEKISRCKFVVAVSSFGRSQLFRWSAYEDWTKVFVVRCGLEPGYFAANAQQSNSVKLVCVGRLCEQKGQMLLVEAARRLLERGVTFTLSFAGDGELRPAIESLIRAHKMESYVRVTGWISSDEVRRELLDARALVLPSFAEGLPIVIMEAMALRRPVVSTFVAGIPELVDTTTGWLVPAGDVDALVEAMEKCLASGVEELNRMGDAARLCVQLHHDADREAAKLHPLFRKKTLHANR